MSDEFTEAGKEVIKSAGKRLNDLHKSLPESTRGILELALMLQYLNHAVPTLIPWALSEEFMGQFTAWVAAGCPDHAGDTPTDILEAFQKGKWVN